MPKEMYKDTNVVNRIDSLSFSMDSPAEMGKVAHIHVVANNLYNQDINRTVIKYGVLDRRLGTNSKGLPCETCGKGSSQCAGHYGYIDLELPVFHVGYFRNIINILQTICKNCARVMLQDNNGYRLKLMNKNLDYLAKKRLRASILEKCKKVRKCPHCKSLNGFVKKMTATKGSTNNSVFRIVCDEYRGKSKEALKECLFREFSSAIVDNSDIKAALENGVTKVLTPIDVLKLFERIPPSDIPLLGMNFRRSLPKDMILTRILVPPVAIRPSRVSDFRLGTTEDDLSMKLSEIIKLNQDIQKNRESGASFNVYQGAWDLLQATVALYFNSEVSGIPPNIKPKKSIMGLVQRLKGKQGRFRGNLSGKRVNFSSRTVISPDPNLEIDEVGVPVHVAKILTYSERVTCANVGLLRRLVINGPYRWPGANYVVSKDRMFLDYGNRGKIAQELKIGDVVERHLQDNDIVLFNRQPSLHRMSIMAHRAKVHQFKTFRFNECVCAPYNADFDGDEMNLHLPQTEEAKAEALLLMGVKYNLVTPRNGELLIAATQDFLTSAYVLTRKDTFLNYSEASQLAATLVAGNDSDLEITLPKPCIMKPVRLWSGKQILSLIFKPNKHTKLLANLEAKGKAYAINKNIKEYNREMSDTESYILIRNSELIAGTLDKNHLGSGCKTGNIFYVILRDFGEGFAIKAMWRLVRLVSYYLTHKGFSMGISDVTPNKVLREHKADLLSKGYERCYEYIKQQQMGQLESQPGCTAEETMENKILGDLSNIREEVGKMCLKQLPATNGPLIMALSGSKGSVINISQMVACVGQQALSGKRPPDTFENRSIPHFPSYSKVPQAKGFVKNSFYSSLTPTEFYFHSMAGREGLVDTAVKTAETGYIQRRLIKCLEDLIVHYDGTVRNANNSIVQLKYGQDGLDPSFMEVDGCPVDFGRVLEHVKAKYPFRNEVALDGEQVRRATEQFFDEPSIKDCDESFVEQIRTFMDKVAGKIDASLLRFGYSPVAREIERLTCRQLVTFLEMCVSKYRRSIIEPGTAVGALAAQSIGEPSTQMTLKTFHFAGVASMNITQGVPRIQEIINATKSIRTPIINAKLMDDTSVDLAREVKGRLEKVVLGQVTKSITADVRRHGPVLILSIDTDRIKVLQLKISLDSIRERILTSLSSQSIRVRIFREESLLLVDFTEPPSKGLDFALSRLANQLSKVIVNGLRTVNRAVIASNKQDGVTKYELAVEGNNLREVIATYGVDGVRTVSNDVLEVYRTLGIEAARLTIESEIKSVMASHGIGVDHRHIMLLSAQMTHTGEVLGITRQGLAKMKQSVLNLASFEKTADHLFDAAYYGQTDKIRGVSENIIMGTQTSIGSGLIKLLHRHQNVERDFKSKELLFESALKE